MNANSWSSWPTRAAALAVVVALFVAGAVTGAAVYRWAELDTQREPRGPLAHSPWEMLAPLELSAEQQQKVRAIYERRKPELDQVLREAMPRLRQVQDSIDADVSRLLTDKQRSQFQTLRRHHGPPPGIPPMGFRGPPGMFPLDERPGVPAAGPTGWARREGAPPPPPDHGALPLPSSSGAPDH